jgi:starvation-inducible outer membrane lipoprotein
MRGERNRLQPGLMVLSLALSLAGCAQTPTILIDDRANIRQHEQLEMVPEPSGQDTDRELNMDMEGGG